MMDFEFEKENEKKDVNSFASWLYKEFATSIDCVNMHVAAPYDGMSPVSIKDRGLYVYRTAMIDDNGNYFEWEFPLFTRGYVLFSKEQPYKTSIGFVYPFKRKDIKITSEITDSPLSLTSEEAQMINIFGEEIKQYCEKNSLVAVPLLLLEDLDPYPITDDHDFNMEVVLRKMMKERFGVEHELWGCAPKELLEEVSKYML